MRERINLDFLINLQKTLPRRRKAADETKGGHAKYTKSGIMKLFITIESI